MYTMYGNASNNIPYTHVSSYVVWRIHPRGTWYIGGALYGIFVHHERRRGICLGALYFQGKS